MADLVWPLDLIYRQKHFMNVQREIKLSGLKLYVSNKLVGKKACLPTYQSSTQMK